MAGWGGWRKRRLEGGGQVEVGVGAEAGSFGTCALAQHVPAAQALLLRFSSAVFSSSLSSLCRLPHGRLQLSTFSRSALAPPHSTPRREPRAHT